MNTTIQDFIKRAAQKTLTPGLASAYAIMHTEVQSTEGDNMCLLLPKDCCPVNVLGQAEQMAHVQFDGRVARWTGMRGKAAQIGTDDEPVAEPVAQALDSDTGLLVLFVNEETAMPDAWTVFRAKAKH